MKETKEQKILWKILKEMYAVSTPPADFDELINDAAENEKGQKLVPYYNHEITKEKYDEIMETNLKNQRLTKLKQQQIKNSVSNVAPKFIIILLLLFYFVGFSQMKPTAQTVEIYNYNSLGVKEIVPTKIIEIKQEQISIYNVDKNGIKEITPIQIIKDNNVYEVDKNGLQELLPRQRIETNTLLTPIKFDSLPILNLSNF